MVLGDFGGGGRFGMTDFMTVKDVRELLNVRSNDTVYSLIESGSLKAFKVGKGGRTSKWLIYRDSLESYIKSRTEQTLQEVNTS